MNKMKFTAFLISFLLLTFLSNTLAQQDPKARKMLDDLAKATKGFTSIKADFSISLENLKDNIKEEFSGSILIKGDKYFLSAMGAETYFDGTTMWTHLKDIGEVYISSPDEDETSILSNPSRLFQIYQEDFKMRYVSDMVVDGKNLAEIDLYPNDLNQQFSRIKLFIHRDKLQIASAMVFGKDGNTYIFDVKSFRTNLPVKDSEFVFDSSANPDVEEIDMRF